jgi:hypothetical protein
METVSRELTPEWRIAERAHAVMRQILDRYRHAPHGLIVPSVGDFYNGIKLEVQYEMRNGAKQEMEKTLAQQAQQKAQLLYMMQRIFEMQKEVDDLGTQIANREHP